MVKTATSCRRNRRKAMMMRWWKGATKRLRWLAAGWENPEELEWKRPEDYGWWNPDNEWLENDGYSWYNNNGRKHDNDTSWHYWLSDNWSNGHD